MSLYSVEKAPSINSFGPGSEEFPGVSRPGIQPEKFMFTLSSSLIFWQRGRGETERGEMVLRTSQHFSALS